MPTLSAPSPTIGVVVVNWNGWENTLKAYESLKQSAFTSWTLVIVDNASTDESAVRLAFDAQNVVLILSDSNRGFAGGCNLGIAKVLELNLDYIFLLNSDAMVCAETLTNLISASTSCDNRAAVGGVVRFSPSGKLQFFGSRRSAMTGRPQWYKEPDDERLLGSRLIDTDFIFGAAFFAPARLFSSVGFFDERFFLNFEETDWCYRAAALGIPRFIVNDAVVHHLGSASLGVVDGPMQTYFLHRNRLLFAEKHASLRQRLRGFKDVGSLIAHKLWLDLVELRTSGAILGLSTRALLLAMRDYLFRRFGDCPPVIRRMAALHRRRTSAHS